LATLIPTCLLILGLTCLCVFLRIKIQSLQVELKALQNPTPIPESAPIQEPVRQRINLWNIPRRSWLSDEKTPNFSKDMRALSVRSHLEFHPWGEHQYQFRGPEFEPWASELLQEIGYHGLPTEVLLEKLRCRKSREWTIQHIVFTVVIPLVSLDSKPESTLLPFPLEVQADLKLLFKELEKKTCK
jgi:hypothetical protein